MSQPGDQTAGTQTEPGAPASGASAPDAAVAAGADTPAAAPPAAAPEGLPADLWADGKLNVEAIVQLHQTVAEAKAREAERAASLPADGVYKLELPADIVDAEGKPVQLDLEHPAYKTLIAAASKLKLTPAEASEFAAMMVREEMAAFKADAEAQLQARQAELAKLGANPAPRVQAIEAQVRAHLGDKAPALIQSITTADALLALESLLQRFTATTAAPPPQAAPPKKSVAELFYGRPNKVA